MSLYLDLKFLNEISYRLDQFDKQGEYTFNFRCVYCGDSKVSKTKARGYFFKGKDCLIYKCHNCAKATNFGKVLQMLDAVAYKRYLKESFHESPSVAKSKSETKRAPRIKNFEEQFPFLIPIVKLPKNHLVWNYVLDRKLPESVWSLLYFVEHTEQLNDVSEKYEGRFTGYTEPRLVIPFFTKNKELMGLTCRALSNTSKKMKYIVVKLIEELDMIFGLDRMNPDMTCVVTEGPIDSLFLPNAIAVGNADLARVEPYVGKEECILVFDNQPRNIEVCKFVSKAIEKGFSVFIWPESIVEKDINEMIQNGKTAQEVYDLIMDQSFNGLKAKMKFVQWRKC
jgi:hypothetical protein